VVPKRELDYMKTRTINQEAQIVQYEETIQDHEDKEILYKENIRQLEERLAALEIKNK
jgi:hypothetical protein